MSSSLGPTALLRLVDTHTYSAAMLVAPITWHSQVARFPMEVSLTCFGGQKAPSSWVTPFLSELCETKCQEQD